MDTKATDELTAALGACRALGIAPERVGRSLGPYRCAFVELSRHPEWFNEHDMRVVARILRQAARIYLLEQDCLTGRYAGPALDDGRLR